MDRRYFVINSLLVFQAFLILYFAFKNSVDYSELKVDKNSSNSSFLSFSDSDSSYIKKIFDELKDIIEDRKKTKVKKYLKRQLKSFLSALSSWDKLQDKFDHLDENEVYEEFNLETPEKKENVDVIMIVTSAPSRFGRRAGIRDTWWKECKSTSRVRRSFILNLLHL